MPTFDAGQSGLVGTVGVTALNPDGTVHTARATGGITEPVAGSGVYHVASPGPGLTLIWDIGVGSIGASAITDDPDSIRDGLATEAMAITNAAAVIEAMPDEPPTVTEIGDAVWAATARTLTDNFSPEELEAISVGVFDRIMELVSIQTGLSIGPGVGSVLHEDTITGRGGVPVQNAIVRAYPFDSEAGTTDWAHCTGSYLTEADGAYHLHLDPGTYTRRVWKNGTVVLDDQVVVQGAGAGV